VSATQAAVIVFRTAAGLAFGATLALGATLACGSSGWGPEDVSTPDAAMTADAAGPGDVESNDGALADAAVSDASVPDSKPPPLTWGACDTRDWPAGYALPSRLVACSTIAVPLDYGDPQGPTITLRVARQLARASPSKGAVFQLAGGPGGSSVVQSGIIPQVMPRLGQSFDLVYVDQRGAGGSGYLGCTGDPETEAEWRACGDLHRREPLQHYLTLEAAHDVDRVRERMGYDRIYLRAGSYGTRLGLEYLRQHEDRVAAAVLDGLDPPNSHFYETFIVNFDRGVNLLVTDCANELDCAAIAPNLSDDFMQRRLALRMTPRPIRVGGQRYAEDEETYLAVLNMGLGDSYYRFRIPRAIAHAVAGDHTEWNALLSDLFGATVTDDHAFIERGARPSLASRLAARREVRAQQYVAPGLYMTVLCAEDLPNTPDLGALEALAARQIWGDDHVLETARACPAWMVSDIGVALRSPVVSSAKTLLMSGAIDLNTFPEDGTHAAETLEHGTHLIVPYATHSTMLVPCGADIMTDFLLADGEMSAVDTSCLDHLQHRAW
jgi:pimeloyl-ACP methyl ester carboxylesterase